jgi:hypothetical protein
VAHAAQHVQQPRVQNAGDALQDRHAGPTAVVVGDVCVCARSVGDQLVGGAGAIIVMTDDSKGVGWRR